jgi:hypothetical protein
VPVGLAGVLVIVLASCATQPSRVRVELPPPETVPAASGGGPAPTSGVAPPPAPAPVREAGCPYLDRAFVEQTNGQRVGKVKVSADTPPSCFFYRSDGAQQLSVRLLLGAQPGTAAQLVDQVAPVATSDPATLPGAWDGGKQPTEAGAVFAVRRAGDAVVVITNQKQTIKAERIAQQVVVGLKL